MRIVAGLAKGRRLAAPATATRPTSDRAREALYSSLSALVDLDGAWTLDLFAGTGAVGLEALSRGAAQAVLVESDRRAVEVLHHNVEAVGLPGARVVRRAVSEFLGGQAVRPFAFVFADPPYSLADDRVSAVLAALAGGGWLSEHAIVVVERCARGDGLLWPDSIDAVRERRYGEGVLWYGRRR